MKIDTAVVLAGKSKKYDWDRLITKFEGAYKSVIYRHKSDTKTGKAVGFET